MWHTVPPLQPGNSLGLSMSQRFFRSRWARRIRLQASHRARTGAAKAGVHWKVFSNAHGHEAHYRPLAGIMESWDAACEGLARYVAIKDCQGSA